MVWAGVGGWCVFSAVWFATRRECRLANAAMEVFFVTLFYS